jgi:hypothetical protein
MLNLGSVQIKGQGLVDDERGWGIHLTPRIVDGIDTGHEPSVATKNLVE